MPAAGSREPVRGAVRTEFAVVGGGLTGLATAWALRLSGREAVVLEQAAIGHDSGGSHGACRIFRFGYEDPEYVALAARARELWTRLEEECGARLLHQVPQLSFGPQMSAVHQAMRASGAACELLTEREAAERFPEIAAAGPVLLEPDSAVIAADGVLTALAGQVGHNPARAARGSDGDGGEGDGDGDRDGGASGKYSGGDGGAGGPGGGDPAGAGPVRCGVRVTALADDGRRVRLTTTAGDVDAGCAIVCAGPWTSSLLATTGIGVPASATLEQVAYLAPADAAERGPAGDDVGQGGAARRTAPIFVHYGGEFPYGLPVPGSNLYKLGLHHGGPVIDPDHQNQAADAALSDRTERAARAILPGFDPRPVAVERCVYDNSPDTDFIVDRIGNVVIGSGTSGHGFKFGPLLGQWLAGLAMTGRPHAAGNVAGTPPHRFALSRFG